MDVSGRAEIEGSGGYLIWGHREMIRAEGRLRHVGSQVVFRNVGVDGAPRHRPYREKGGGQDSM